ncbi:MAG TPA: phosphatase [Atribacteraceae bacterium]|nr:phosphatase [Atribacteraceae bacterium]
MIRIAGDLHVHTVASGHAYSTVLEIVHTARRKGLSVVGVADHGPSMPGGPSLVYFEACGHFPRQVAGVTLYFGAEVDILDEKGTLDLPDWVLKKMDYTIVSFHPHVRPPGDRETNTQSLLKVLMNPLVNIIAHAGNPKYPFDYERVIDRAVEAGKVFEINNSSFSVSRKGSWENCRLIAQEVMKRGGSVLVSSDAHFCEEIGEYHDALALLEDIGFPEERILNMREESLKVFVEQHTGRRRRA